MTELSSLELQNGAWLALARLATHYPAPSDTALSSVNSPSPNHSAS